MKTVIALLIVLMLAGCAAPQAPPEVQPAVEPTPAPAPAPEPSPAPAPEPQAAPEAETLPGPTTATSPVTLKQGFFHKVVHPTDGRVAIDLLPSGEKILNLFGFDTTPGPGLIVVLHSGQVKDGFVVGTLISASGNYPYDLPKDLDVSKYTRVAIYNKKYNVIYGEAELK
jgi:hypothetical protein